MTETVPSRILVNHRCLIYSIAGALVATTAHGRRYVIQAGGFAMRHDDGLAVCGPGWPGEHQLRNQYDLHCWFTEVPPGADPEDAWLSPRWLQVIDLYLGNVRPVSEASGLRWTAGSLPGYCWDRPDRIRGQLGLEYRSDRATMSRFLGLVAGGPLADYWDDYVLTAGRVASVAAAKLGLRLTATAGSVVPVSFFAAAPVAFARDDPL